jgi:hypothetical protein
MIDILQKLIPNSQAIPGQSYTMRARERQRALRIASLTPLYRRMEEHLTRVSVIVSGRLNPRVRDVINEIAERLCEVRGQDRPSRMMRRYKPAMIRWFCEHFPQLVTIPLDNLVHVMRGIGFIPPPRPPRPLRPERCERREQAIRAPVGIGHLADPAHEHMQPASWDDCAEYAPSQFALETNATPMMVLDIDEIHWGLDESEYEAIPFDCGVDEWIM